MSNQQLSAYVLRFEGTHYLKVDFYTTGDGTTTIQTSGHWDIRDATKFTFWSQAVALGAMCQQLLEGKIDICRVIFTPAEHDPLYLEIVG